MSPIGQTKESSCGKIGSQLSMETRREIQKNMAVYNFDTIDADGKTEVQLNCLQDWSGREDLNLRPPGPEPSRAVI